MAENGALHGLIARRKLLAAASAARAAVSRSGWAQTVDLALPGGPGARQITAGDCVVSYCADKPKYDFEVPIGGSFLARRRC
jgi:hypothetical protein